MTDEVQTPETAEEWTCSMCGHDGGPYAACGLCHGNQRFLEKGRMYTLSEERQGKNPDANKRYGLHGEVGPKIVVLPGGVIPGQG